MTNDEYLQWKPLIKKVAWKYKNNRYNIELEDLEQIGAMGLMYALEHYENNRGTLLKTFIYDCVERKIFREFQNMERIKRQVNYNTTSLDVPININDGSDMFLSDIIADDNIDIESEALEWITIDEYIKEFNLILSPMKANIFIDKYVNNLKSKDIESKYKKTPGSLNTILRQCRSELVRKSYRIRAEYEKYINIQSESLNIYRNPSRVEDECGYYDSRLRFIDKMNNRQIKEDAELLNYYRGRYEERQVL